MPVSTPFAAGLVLEAAPLQTQFWWQYIQVFLQDAGAFALLGLWIWILATFLKALVPSTGARRRGVPLLLLLVAVLALILYAVGGIGFTVTLAAAQADMPTDGSPPPQFGRIKLFSGILALGGLLALSGVMVPFLFDLTQLRFRRIWALTRLTFLDAIRGRVLWVFLILLIPFLFPPKWFIQIKPEDEIRTNVAMLHFGATAFLLLAATAMASFSIPTDIRNQTIHTVVTKPVEKFEIVIGRFIGFLGMTTAVMLAVFGFGLLLLIFSRIDPESQRESMKARVPVYGQLLFAGPGKNYQGESVGREWEYRKYVPGGGESNPHRAIWSFNDTSMSRGLEKLPHVNCEFSFDIFRTTKGEENKSVECTFYVVTHQVLKANGVMQNIRNLDQVTRAYQQKTKGLSQVWNPTGTDAEQRDWSAVGAIAKELGYYEYRSKPISDYHTESIPIPSSLFEKAYESDPDEQDQPGYGKVPGPRVMVLVRCDSRTQFLGVAQPDLYLMAAEGSFYLNFFKGAAGLWMRLILVIGIAVTCSTYLNGVVSFLVTMVFVGLGSLKPFVMLLAMQITADVPNPGPADSVRKLLSNESLGTAPDATNPTAQVTAAADEGFRWLLRRVISAFPDLHRLTWQAYVANGFNVPTEDVLWSLLATIGYLSLWAILAHYLMKWREIATW